MNWLQDSLSRLEEEREMGRKREEMRQILDIYFRFSDIFWSMPVENVSSRCTKTKDETFDSRLATCLCLQVSHNLALPTAIHTLRPRVVSLVSPEMVASATPI